MEVKFVDGLRVSRATGRGWEDGAGWQAEQGHRAAHQPPAGSRRGLCATMVPCSPSESSWRARPTSASSADRGSEPRCAQPHRRRTKSRWWPRWARRRWGLLQHHADARRGRRRGAGAFKVVFLTDVEGWRAVADDPSTRISEATADESASASPGGGRHAPKSRPRYMRSIPGRERATSWMAASATRCCSSCSPTRASGPSCALKELQSLERDAVMETYAGCGGVRPRGARAVGRRGHEYLDFFCGAGVTQLGALPARRGGSGSRSGGRLLHTSNSSYRPGIRLAKRLVDSSIDGGRSCATPAPRRWSALKLGRKRRRGGRSWCGGRVHGPHLWRLSATPQESKQAPSRPRAGFSMVRPRTTQGLHRRGGRVHGGSAARAGQARAACTYLRRGAAGGAAGLRPRRCAPDLRRGAVRHGPHRVALGVAADAGAPRRDDGAKGIAAACPWAPASPARSSRRAPVRRSRHHLGAARWYLGPRCRAPPRWTTRSF